MSPRAKPFVRSLLTFAAVLAVAPLAAAQSAPAPAPAAAVIADGPAKGSWELFLPVGGLTSINGQTTGAQNQMALGIELGRHLSTDLLLNFGLGARISDGYSGAEAHIDVKFRPWDLHRIVKPFLLGGVGFTWGFPGGQFRNKRTITAVGMRMGVGLDFAITQRVLFGMGLTVDPGPRIQPGLEAYMNLIATFGWTFRL